MQMSTLKILLLEKSSNSDITRPEILCCERFGADILLAAWPFLIDDCRNLIAVSQI
jgi:hypothetical protein